MKRRGRLLLPLAALLLDGMVVAASAWAAYAIRFSEWLTRYIPVVTAQPPLQWYFRLSILHAALTVGFLMTGGLHRFPRQDGRLEEMYLVLKRYSAAFMFLLALLFFYRGASFSRLTMALLFIVGALALTASRLIFRRIREWLYRRGTAVRRAALAGGGAQADAVLAHLRRHPEFGIQLCGCLTDQSGSAELTRLGGVADASPAIKRHRIDTIIIAPGAGDAETLHRLIRACYGVNVDFLYLPDLLPGGGRPRRMVEVGGTPLWALKESPFQGWPGVAKRTFDLAVSLLLLTALIPVFLIVALAIKLDSRGPVFYRQRRIGQDGRVFNCLKFRSMTTEAEKDAKPGWTTKADPRVTKVGRFIRRWTVDELPQLINVLKGDMSLVGPRPERPEWVSQFERKIEGYHERHRVKAGMTGWAQVNGLRGDSSIDDRTAYDRYYVENWSLVFDLKIILKTISAVVRGENSY